MKNKKKNIGFIGVGYMGSGIAFNLINKGFKLYLLAHKNIKPINKLTKLGATKISKLEDLTKYCEIIIMCVPNTKIADKLINKILVNCKKKLKIIDITTHSATGTHKIYKKLKAKKIIYVESPVMGGPVQAKEGNLGAIVGCEKKHFNFAKNILDNFCKEVIYFGTVGSAAKAKLISNFLSLGTATFVIETFKAAKILNIDIKKLYKVAKLGSGNSNALHRIANNAIRNNYKGYIFSVENSLKDLTYISDLLNDIPDAKKLTQSTKSIYQKAKKNGFGKSLISELIKIK